MIQSIERAAAILEVIAEAGGAARLGYIAEETGLGKATRAQLNRPGLDGDLGYATSAGEVTV